MNSPIDEASINALRFLAVDAIQKANSGHPGLPLGTATIAYTLWANHMRHDPATPDWFDRDRFVLSAGHGSALLYALLHLCGYDVPLSELRRFRQLGSITPGHPEVGVTPGVEVTTGPLGQGFANAVGLAIAEAHLGARYNRAERIVDHFTYCLAGDGCMMEGISGEAASLAGHLKLGKLVVFYDDNAVTLAGPTSVCFDEDVPARFRAYGWQTLHCEQSNDVSVVNALLEEARADQTRPTLISLRTHIGYGSPKHDTYGAHGEPLGADNVIRTKRELGWPVEPDFFVPPEVREHYAHVLARGSQRRAEWTDRLREWQAANRDLASEFLRVTRAERPAHLSWPVFDAQNGSIASRDAGGIVMNAIAADMPELVGGSADLDPSTKTYLHGQGDFQPGSYEGRNVHFGVREHAMGAISNGIALHGGLRAFCATFFNFTDYMKPAMRLAALSRTKVVYVMTHDSFFLGEDGPTHQPIEQLAALRSMPGMTVIRPADSVETRLAWEHALFASDGPATIVLSRQKLPFLGAENRDFARGAYVIRDPAGPIEALLVATGSEVSLALDAALLLGDRGIEVRVVSMPSMELFRRQDAEYRDRVLPPDVSLRVSVEAASTFGWREWVGDRGIAVGVDRFGVSAPAPDAANELGFTPSRIADLVEAMRTTSRQERSTAWTNG